MKPTIRILLLLLWISPLVAQVEKESEESVRARYEYWVRKRLDASGNFSMESVLRAKAELDGKMGGLKTRSPLDAGITSWEWLGPGNIGGRIKDLLIHPTNTNLMWIASPGGGIWRTTNAGGRWAPVDDFLPVLNVVSLAMDPTNDQVMYAGTGELAYQGWKIKGVGIYKSTDGGNHWFQLSSTIDSNFYYVSRLAHHPTTANTLLAAVVGGVYRTTNGGSIWTRVLTPAGVARDVEYHPLDPNKVLVGTTVGVYYSTNGGTNWIRQDTTTAGKIPWNRGASEIAFARSNANYLYASIDANGGELWRSTNGGGSWELRSSTITANPIWRATALWVSPTDPELVVVGGTKDLIRNTSGGSGAWAIISNWMCYQNGFKPAECLGFSPHGDHHIILNHPGYNATTNSQVFVCDDGGIQMTLDINNVGPYSGWTNLANNLGITQFYGGAASPDGGLIVGGTQDLYNVNYYKNISSWWPDSGTQGWRNYIYGDGGFAAVDYKNPANIYVESQFLNIDRSVDSGKKYETRINGLTDATHETLAPFVAPFVMDPNNPHILVAGATQIWRTIDSAENWSSIRLPILNNPQCSAIDIHKANSSVIWIGYNNGTVSFTTNSGTTWTDVSTPWGSRYVTDIAINPTPSTFAEVIVTVGGYSTDNVWLSSNNGVSWVQRTGVPPHNLPAIQVNTVRYHPLQTNWVYVGTDLGVFASEDKGLTWNITPLYQGNEGPLNTPVEELFWQGTSYLIAATHGRGMWRSRPLPIVYVDGSYVGSSDGTEFRPFKTVTDAVNAYGPGALVSIKTGTYNEPVMNLKKRGKMKATGGVVHIK